MSARDSNLYVSRRVRRCLARIAEATGDQIDNLADGVLTAYIKTSQPKLWALYEQHEQEEKALLDSIKPSTTEKP